MTKIYFTQKEGKYIGFKVSGHTGKAEHGKDVLCAAISAVSQMAVYTVCEVLKEKAKLEIRDGFLSLNLQNPSSGSQTVLEGLYGSLKSICENEKKYLKLEVQNAI